MSWLVVGCDGFYCQSQIQFRFLRDPLLELLREGLREKQPNEELRAFSPPLCGRLF